MKWKPKELNTIDFRVKLISQTSDLTYLWGLFTFYTDIHDRKKKHLQLFDFIFMEYAPENKNEWLRSLISSCPGFNCIIECTFDPEFQHPHQLVCNKLKDKYRDPVDNVDLDAVKANFNFNMQLSEDER